jgi:uncharacterized membrane protein
LAQTESYETKVLTVIPSLKASSMMAIAAKLPELMGYIRKLKQKTKP